MSTNQQTSSPIQPGPETRIPQILQMQLANKSQNEIAEALDVSRMQVWRDRQSPLYLDLVKRFYEDTYVRLIREFETGTSTQKVAALKELGRMYRAGMKRQIETRSASIDYQIRETRVGFGSLWDKLSDSARDELRVLMLNEDNE